MTSRDFHKTVPAICKRDDRLDDLDIVGSCFWLGILYEGSIRLELNGRVIDATAPCFICLDERESPRLIRKRGIRCDSVYFNPTFININMTFDRIHSMDYEDLASLHDLFLLAPFTDRANCVFPFFDEFNDSLNRMYGGMEREFKHQSDWYWSCRSRSYMMEIIFMLERAYEYFSPANDPGESTKSSEDHLKNAVIYIESHYPDQITLSDISAAAQINHTTLTKLFRDEFGVTPVEYVWRHRIAVAKKQLEFTYLPIKDISARCGFKTVQHFCRRFEQEAGQTPSEFREVKFQKRVNELNEK